MAGKYFHPTRETTPPQVEQLTCVKCHGALTLRAKGFSTTLICPYCGAIYKASAKGIELEGVSANKSNIEPLIPLGTRGKLHGVTWEVIGFMQRRSSTNNTWQEYLLFNPYKGFRWLTEFNGHWNYVVSLHMIPKIRHNLVTYLNQNYPFYASYQASVRYVIGEFYWRVQANDQCDINDYVNAPNILTQETTLKSKIKPSADPYGSLPGEAHSSISTETMQSYQPTEGEQIWSLAEYIEPETIQTAFGLKEKLPEKIGASINQPFKQTNELTAVVSLGFIGAVIMSIFAFVLMIAIPNKTLVMGEIIAPPTINTNVIPPIAAPTEAKPPLVSPTFEITNSKGLLRFNMQAPVTNNWVEIEATLINEDTGKSLYFDDGVEYYYGYDSEGRWSEGSQTDSKVFTALPKGKYHLVFDVTSGAAYDIPIKYQFKQGGVSGGNYLFALILMLLPSFAGLGYYFYFNYNRSIS